MGGLITKCVCVIFFLGFNLYTILIGMPDHLQIMEFYGVPDFRTPLEFLALLAKRQGKLKKGGLPDCDKAAKSVLIDWTGWVNFSIFLGLEGTIYHLSFIKDFLFVIQRKDQLLHTPSRDPYSPHPCQCRDCYRDGQSV